MKWYTIDRRLNTEFERDQDLLQTRAGTVLLSLLQRMKGLQWLSSTFGEFSRH
jgi:hypothetical protein